MKLLQSIYDYIWFKWYLRGDEFSPKLDLNINKLMTLNNEERIACQLKIGKLRQKAHELDLKYNS